MEYHLGLFKEVHKNNSVWLRERLISELAQASTATRHKKLLSGLGAVQLAEETMAPDAPMIVDADEERFMNTVFTQRAYMLGQRAPERLRREVQMAGQFLFEESA